MANSLCSHELYTLDSGRQVPTKYKRHAHIEKIFIYLLCYSGFYKSKQIIKIKENTLFYYT